MREMKDSGIEWIGEIPIDWQLPKVKNLFTIGRGRVISQLELEESGYPVYSSQTKNNGCLGYISTYDFDRSQLTWTTDGANAGTVFLREGKHNCTNVCGTLMPKNDKNSLNYLKYALEFIAIYHKRADINGYKIMNNEMAEIIVTLPTRIEQEKIARFLDAKCAELDNILSKTRASIEEYKKLKQAIITQAVTKGMREDRPLVPSEIRWVQELPKGWKSINPKALFTQRKDKALEGERQLTASQQYGVIYQDEYMEITGNKIVTVEKDFSILKHVETGDFVISMRSFQGGLEYSENTGSISSAYVMLIPNLEKVYPRFYKWLFKSSVYINALQSTSDLVRDGQAMRYSNFSQVRLYEIPMKEQQEIADYLDVKCAEIDSLIAKKEQYHAEIENYKKSLIYEYVTGKKEVPQLY